MCIRDSLDSIGHNPHELASYLTALLQSYTPQSAQAELERIFSMQYTLTLTEEVEIRYRTCLLYTSRNRPPLIRL